MNGIADLDWGAADFTVLDIRVAAHRKVQDHRNFFSTIGAGEGVFHGAVRYRKFLGLTTEAVPLSKAQAQRDLVYAKLELRTIY